jgi:O-methyltransferase involved in polyketide biosynthesis
VPPHDDASDATAGDPAQDLCPAATEDRPSVARIHNILLGGSGRLPADEHVARELLKLVPDAVMVAYQARNFVQRAARFLARQEGIRQFIDIGAGLPAPGGNVTFAQHIPADTRVAYVDCDPAAIARVQATLVEDRQAIAIPGDLRDPERIFNDPPLRALINLDEPVAIVLGAVLHFISDDEDPYGVVDTIKMTVAPGSYLALSHATGDELSPEVIGRVRDLYQATTASLTFRTVQEVTRFMDSLDIIRPGVVNCSAWRPGYAVPEPRRTVCCAGLARKSGGKPWCG